MTPEQQLTTQFRIYHICRRNHVTVKLSIQNQMIELNGNEDNIIQALEDLANELDYYLEDGEWYDA